MLYHDGLLRNILEGRTKGRLIANSLVHQVQACFSYIQGYAYWNLTLTLLSSYSYVFESSSSFNLLQVLTLIWFSVFALSVQLPQLFGTSFPSWLYLFIWYI